MSRDEVVPVGDDLADPLDLPALDEALTGLAAEIARRTGLVRLRSYAGLSLPDAANLLGVSQSAEAADWTYSKTFLKRQMEIW